ncbi:MAG: response regulator [Gammaproteobacteria bacterium]|nr:response regulator [Gammaproteobacteria bacterium]
MNPAQAVHSDMQKVALESMSDVGHELARAIDEARVKLETYLERRDNPDALTDCATILHQARGVLTVVEMYGAAQLAEEMERVCRCVLETPARPETDALEVLSRSLVQLPAYVERLLAGARDIPMVLLPLLNDLRTVRGAPLLNENTLFLQSLSRSSRPPEVLTRKADARPLIERCKDLRPRFQSALLGWITGNSAQDQVKLMLAICMEFEEAASNPAVHRLWRVVGALLEALRENGIEVGAAVKRLLGQVDRQIKRIIDEGEEKYAESAPDDLVNNMLYYIGRSRAGGRRVADVKRAFDLEKLLPAADEVNRERHSLAGPSPDLMRTVGSAIKDDLAQVKDGLDIFLRLGKQDSAELESQRDLLRKIGDTLGMLGLEHLRHGVEAQRARMGQLITGDSDSLEPVLMEIAGNLLRLEDRLDTELFELVDPTQEDALEDEGKEPDAEFRSVMVAVTVECLVNLAKVKEAIVNYVAHPGDRNMLEPVSAQMRGIRAAMLILEKERVSDLVERIGDYVQHHIRFAGRPATSAQVDRIADAIVSLEYYLETVRAGRADPWYMLDNAEACMKALRRADDLPEFASSEQETVSVTQLYEADSEIAHMSTTNVAFSPTRVVSPERKKFEVFVANERSDPEILEIFIEEAKEESASIAANMAKWQEQPADKQAIQDLRRSFHTIKGSGRMVGAQLLGEFAWSQENLLNRLIDGTVPLSDEVLHTLKAAGSAIPELIEQLEVGTDPDYDVDSLMETAWSLADAPASDSTETIVRPDEAQLGVAGGMARTGEQAPAAEAPTSNAIEMDVALLEIFSKETSSHLETLWEFIKRCEDRDPPFALTEEVRRAVHTLHGSANMASVEPVVAIAEPLDHFISEAYNTGQRIPASALGVLEDAAEAIRALLAMINQPGELPDNAQLLARVRALQSDALEVAVPTSGLEVGEFEIQSSEEEGDTIVTELVVADDAELFPDVDGHETGTEAETPTEATDSGDFTEGEPPPPAPAYQAPGYAGTGEPPSVDESDSSADVGEPDEPTRVFSTSLVDESLFAAKTAGTPAGAEFTESGYDAEIAGIFADEASELLESAQSDLHEIEAGSGTEAALSDLKRQLHTLKGGARMAGLVAMGDLSHELESLLDRETGGHAGPETALLSLVQSGLDRLHKMRECISDGGVVEADLPLLENIRQWRAAPAEAPGTSELYEKDDVAEHEASADSVAVENDPASATQGQTQEESQEESQEELQEEIQDKTQEESQEIGQDGSAGVPAEGPAEAEHRFSEPVIEPVRAGFAAPDVIVPPEVSVDRRERARVDADLLQSLLDNAGEISIFRSRLEQQINSAGFNLTELSQTVTRLRDQLRKLEIETEAQIRHGHEADTGSTRDEFDPLELDRYSTIQQLSRSLAETTGDLMSIQELLDSLVKESDNLLVQQGRVTTELQHGLMRTRMVPFQSSAQRLGRIVRQTASGAHKQAELHIEGGQGEMDRQMLDRLMPALEHMLRNAVIHGIENEDLRARRGKPDIGQISIKVRREGAETIVELRDDGGGLDLPRLRQLGIADGLISDEAEYSDEEIMQLVFRPGLSTAEIVTQTAGRGVGMDVVANEVRKLGGSIHIESEAEVGTRFVIRLPFTLAVSQALLVTTGDETYALPLTTVEGVTRIPRADIEKRMAGKSPTLEYGGREYPMQFLGALLGNSAVRIVEDHVSVPVVLVRAGEQSAALITDDMLGGREIVVKSVGPQLSTIRGISGATILGDGRTILILDLGALIREGAAVPGVSVVEESDQRTFVLVVDDSITVRRVTQRLLERNGMRVLTAKDGVDAVTLLQEHRPDVILLDIEMPRMDGYEVAAQVRGDPRLRDVPIIMITSRVGLKHRARAIELGVNDYLGKPYQESQLLDAIEPLVSKKAETR